MKHFDNTSVPDIMGKINYRHRQQKQQNRRTVMTLTLGAHHITVRPSADWTQYVLQLWKGDQLVRIERMGDDAALSSLIGRMVVELPDEWLQDSEDVES